MADFHRGMDFVQDDPFSMGNPFGGRSFGGEGGGWEEDEFGGIGESQYPDTPHYNEEAESQYIKEQQVSIQAFHEKLFDFGEIYIFSLQI